MKYGDFSSLVQLGVGLHAGTALLQLYGEIGAQPLIRRIARIKALIDDGEGSPNTQDQLTKIESDLDIFKIKHFNEYTKYVWINCGVAALLAAVLIFISYMYDDPISEAASIFVVCASLFPAPITLWILWHDASVASKHINAEAQALEDRLLGR
jgi:hypothetical protein